MSGGIGRRAINIKGGGEAAKMKPAGSIANDTATTTPHVGKVMLIYGQKISINRKECLTKYLNQAIIRSMSEVNDQMDCSYEILAPNNPFPFLPRIGSSV